METDFDEYDNTQPAMKTMVCVNGDADEIRGKRKLARKEEKGHVHERYDRRSS
jgi:hypothetical protein